MPPEDEVRGLLSRVVPFSQVDGPGNRMAIFLQRCNLRCIACHNPHTMGACTGCFGCVSRCPSGALGAISGNERPHYQEARCLHCDRCIDGCRQHANPQSRWATVGELVASVRRAAPFLSGVTVSGGEATLQHEFVAAFFRALKADSELSPLHTLVDSNGMAKRSVWLGLLDGMDHAAIDLKAFDSALHVRLTGATNELVKESIALLAEQKKLLEVRVLVIADYNDTDAEAAAMGEFLARVASRTPVRVIPFRREGVLPTHRALRPPDKPSLERLCARMVATGAGPVRIG